MLQSGKVASPSPSCPHKQRPADAVGRTAEEPPERTERIQKKKEQIAYCRGDRKGDPLRGIQKESAKRHTVKQEAKAYADQCRQAKAAVVLLIEKQNEGYARENAEQKILQKDGKAEKAAFAPFSVRR